MTATILPGNPLESRRNIAPAKLLNQRNFPDISTLANHPERTRTNVPKHREDFSVAYFTHGRNFLPDRYSALTFGLTNVHFSR